MALVPAPSNDTSGSPPRAAPDINPFRVGELYSRDDIAETIGLPPSKRGGNWDTGYAKPFDSFFLFVNVGAKGRTGHDYPNRWEGNDLLWSARNGTRLGQGEITALLDGAHPVHIFWRAKDRARFTYAGLGAPIDVEDTTPVRVRWALDPGKVAPAASPSPAHRRRGPPPVAGERTTVYEDGPTSVYLLVLEGPMAQLFPDLPDGQRVVKVGRSNDPVRRIADLSCGIPPGCTMRWTLVAGRQFPSADEADAFEQMLHERLRIERKWIGGEFAAVDEAYLKGLASLK